MTNPMKNKKRWFFAFAIVVLCIIIGAFVVNSGKVHWAIASWFGSYLDKQTEEYAALMKDEWDREAEELRSLSIAKRQQYLERRRVELGTDSDELFIRAMNERGVHFEEGSDER